MRKEVNMNEDNSIETNNEGDVKVPAEPPPATEFAEESIDEKEEINRLLDEGYSVKQIIDLGFKRRTAYHHPKNVGKARRATQVDGGTVRNAHGIKRKYDMMKL